MLAETVREWTKEWESKGRQEGEATILTCLLRRRFGNLPDWASEKIAKAKSPSLDAWSLRFVDTQALDEVFSDKG